MSFFWSVGLAYYHYTGYKLLCTMSISHSTPQRSRDACLRIDTETSHLVFSHGYDIVLNTVHKQDMSREFTQRYGNSALAACFPIDFRSVIGNLATVQIILWQSWTHSPGICSVTFLLVTVNRSINVWSRTARRTHAVWCLIYRLSF